MNGDPAIWRYQNDPIFHQFTDALVGFLERGYIDRYGFLDSLRVAEMIAFNKRVQSDPLPVADGDQNSNNAGG